MGTPDTDSIRLATAADGEQLLHLWALVFSEDDPGSTTAWRTFALEWFSHVVADPFAAHFPVLEAGGGIVSTAIGTLEVGVPNPHSPRGRAVRLANVVTLPGHRGRGYATLLVRDVIEWARSIEADRVDLSATADGLPMYEKAGFTVTRAPRMKLVL